MRLKIPSAVRRYIKRDDGEGQELDSRSLQYRDQAGGGGSVVSEAPTREDEEPARENNVAHQEQMTVCGADEAARDAAAQDEEDNDDDDAEERAKEESAEQQQRASRRPGRLADASFKTIAVSVVVALIVSLAVVETKASDDVVITSDAHFYGDSPPVYPSRMLHLFFKYLPVLVHRSWGEN